MEKSQLIKEIKVLEVLKLPAPPIDSEDYVLLKVDELDKEPKIIRKRSSEIRTLKITKK